MSGGALVSVHEPSDAAIARFIGGQTSTAFTYTHVGLTGSAQSPPGYWVSHRSVALGHGDAVFAAATAALHRWEMFNVGWVRLFSPDVDPVPGAVVGVLARCLGIWWLNAARVVYSIDEPRRHGFAYGTLPGHAERGEERFLVEMMDDGSIWYDLFAFSQPAHWLAKLGHPVARRFQKKFAADSLQAMRRFCEASLTG